MEFILIFILAVFVIPLGFFILLPLIFAVVAFLELTLPKKFAKSVDKFDKLI